MGDKCRTGSEAERSDRVPLNNTQRPFTSVLFVCGIRREPGRSRFCLDGKPFICRGSCHVILFPRFPAHNRIKGEPYVRRTIAAFIICFVLIPVTASAQTRRRTTPARTPRPSLTELRAAEAR